MNKVLVAIAVIFLSFSIIMFIRDLLPVDLSSDSNSVQYLKSVSSESIDWASYKIHALVIGIALLLLSKLVKLFG